MKMHFVRENNVVVVAKWLEMVVLVTMGIMLNASC